MPSEQIAVDILDFYKKLKNQQNQKERVYTKVKLEHKIKTLRRCQNDLENIVKNNLSISNVLQCNNNENRLISVVKNINEKIVQMEENIRELNEPFLLFIIGMGNYGKSTLLNALLGSEVAEMDFLPKTWKIDIFYGSDNKKAQIYYKSGQVDEIYIEDAKKLLEEEELKRQKSEDIIDKKLKDMKKELLSMSIEEREETKKFLQDQYLYQSQITEVRWPLHKNELLNNFRLVDTPGLKQTLLGEDMKSSLSDYYHKADGVLWLLDGNKISAQKSRQLMDELNESLSEVGGKTDNIIAVLNYMDKIRKREGQDAVDKIVDEAHNIYGDIFKDIIPISAKEAFEGKKNGDFELVKNSGINELMNAISSRFLEKANEVQINSKLQGIKGIGNDIIKNLNEYQGQLKEDNEKRKKLAQDFDGEMSSKKMKFNISIESLFQNYRKKVENNISIYTDKLFDLDGTSRNNFIKEKIYEEKYIIGEITRITNDAMREFQVCYERYAKTSMFKQYKYINANLENNGLSVSIKEISVPKFYGMDFDTTIDSEFFSFLNDFEFTGKIIRWVKSLGIKSDLKNGLYKIIDSLTRENKAKIEQYVKNVRESIEEIRENSFKALFCSPNVIEPQLAVIDELKNELNRKISKNDIHEYITGKIKTGV